MTSESRKKAILAFIKELQTVASHASKKRWDVRVCKSDTGSPAFTIMNIKDNDPEQAKNNAKLIQLLDPPSVLLLCNQIQALLSGPVR